MLQAIADVARASSYSKSLKTTFNRSIGLKVFAPLVQRTIDA